MKTFIVLLFSVTSAVYGASDLKEKALNLVNERPVIASAGAVPLSRHISILDAGEGKHKTIYVGKRKSDVSRSEFVREMNKHITIVKELFKSRGLLHYSVYLTDEYELAVQEWVSERHAQNAFSSTDVSAMREHAERLLAPVAFAKVDEIVCSNLESKNLSYRFLKLNDEYYKHQVVRKADRSIQYRDVLEWIDYQGALVLESKKTQVNLEHMNEVIYTYTKNVGGEFKEVTETLNCEEL